MMKKIGKRWIIECFECGLQLVHGNNMGPVFKAGWKNTMMEMPEGMPDMQVWLCPQCDDAYDEMFNHLYSGEATH